MFPMSITLNVTNADQLNALAAIAGNVKVVAAEKKVTKATDTCADHKPADTVKKSDAATAPVDTKSTAETTAVQETMADNSAVKTMSVDERAGLVKTKVAAVGRDTVVALLGKYNAKKASEIAADKLAEFDAELVAL